MATKNIKKILLNKDGDNFVADIENIENRITQNGSNLETTKQELSNKCDTVLSDAKAYTDTEKAKLFNSTNGTFTGPEYFRDVNNSVLRFNGGNTHDGGANLQLYGKNAHAPGHFDLVASTKEDASDAKQLIGMPDGSLTWNGKNIVRSVNGVDADDKGNVSVVGILGSVTGEIKYFAFNTVPDGYLVCNGAKVSRTTYADLFKAIGTLYGKGDGINATSKYGTAVFDGEDGNLIRVTVATNESDASSFDVTTYFKGSLVETQTVKKATKLVNNSYIAWDTSVALVTGDDVTFTGGTGSTFNLPNLIDKFIQGSTTVGTVKSAGLPNITGWFGAEGGPRDASGALSITAYSSWSYGSYSGVGHKVSLNASKSSPIYGNSETVQPPALTLLPCIKY